MARQQHYVFAHQTLPGVFFDHPGPFLQLMQVDGEGWMKSVWDRLGNEMSPDDLVGQESPHVQVSSDGDRWTALVTMPHPESPPEAYFVALTGVAHGGSSPTDDPRCFTLELGSTPATHEQYTVLCSWAPDHTHYNHGSGPEPTAPNFLREVDHLLAS